MEQKKKVFSTEHDGRTWSRRKLKTTTDPNLNSNEIFYKF